MCVHEVFLIETRNNLTTLDWLSNLDGGDSNEFTQWLPLRTVRRNVRVCI